jgi:predicted ATP-grasp superfamily ATP-dependent carboligase
MRLFVCEFITGGGMQDADLPPALAREGDMMLSALLSDLEGAGYDDIVCTLDSRLEKAGTNIEFINPGKNAWQTWQQCMTDCDAVWLIAPETSNILYDLTCMAEECNCLLIGSSSAAVELSTRKSVTIEHLMAHQIPTVPVLHDIDNLVSTKHGWLIKPDDGVGGEGCYLFNDRSSLQQHINFLNSKNFIVQEYMSGIPASISMLCLQGQTCVVGCNEQLFAFENGKGHLSGVVVNNLLEHQQEFKKIAHEVANAIDGLAGYIGIDLVITEQGPVVIEINPRLTTAYAGLALSLGRNPAEMVMTLMQSGRFPELHEVNYQPVTVRF